MSLDLYIDRFIIKGYRSISDIEIELNQLNVMTGPNGCGKSNLYKAIYLLSQGARGQLANTLALEGGMPSILWAGETKSYSRIKKPIRMSM